jgi:phosphoribosyl-ATP pyrophosphohydrolase/phosphoribosyl-AMP cyclohydrolase
MTDRTLRSAADLESLRFDPESGLLPVIAQDGDTGDVLMLAWANRESLTETLQSGEMTYWSRSREELWRKGATSGNVQRLVTLHADCDGDAVLARVRPAGPACHTQEATCFGEGASSRPILDALWETLIGRARERPEGSYTARLLDDENLRTKKLGEETAELIVALMRIGGGDGAEAGDLERGRAAEEAADLIYHVLVALLAAGVTLEDVMAELERRR